MCLRGSQWKDLEGPRRFVGLADFRFQISDFSQISEHEQPRFQISDCNLHRLQVDEQGCPTPNSRHLLRWSICNLKSEI